MNTSMSEDRDAYKLTGYLPSYLQRSARVGFSRYLSWQLAQAAPASRSPCTNLGRSALPTGTGRPFAQVRPGTVSRFADSTSVRALFSTVSHFPNVSARGSVAVEGSFAGVTLAGSSTLSEKDNVGVGK